MSFRLDIEHMRADVAELGRGGGIGYLRRRPGSIEHLLDRAERDDYHGGLDAIAAYGAYLVAWAEAMRDKPADPPRMVPLRTPRGF